MIYRVTHTTSYDYSQPVTVSHHVARLQPRPTPAQRAFDFDLVVSPEPAVRTMHTDYFGNRVCFFSVEQLHTKLEVSAVSTVEVTAEALQTLDVSPAWETVAEMFRDPVSPSVAEAYQFVFDSPLLHASPELADYARESFPAETPLLIGVRDLTRRIHRDFKFDATATTISTPLHEVFQKRRGVCQDFAHLAIACVRSVGLPARYVSGYLRTDPPPGKPRLIGADASHAWFSVFCPHLGFVDFDPTNDCLPADRHVTAAIGRDFSEVSPLAGVVVGGGAHRLKVAVSVVPEE
jgi:transglutaminase-like putative cysteine protease